MLAPIFKAYFHTHTPVSVSVPLQALLSMPHLAPSYDMWQFGCLLAFTATGLLPFDTAVANIPTTAAYGYDREHWILGAIVQRLGHMPRGVSAC
jgi:hypothetical protein